MKCDKLFKEAFEGIEFRYKLDDTLEGLGNQKLSAKQLEGYLLGKGVSPKEIKQSGVLDGMINDNRAFSGSEWLAKSGSQRLNTFNVSPYDLQYDKITLGGKGYDTMSYAETLSTVAKPENKAPSTPHFSDEISTPKESLLGWRRTHIDEINGKKTLVLNEFQSDWAQTERAGRGIFESTKSLDEEFIKSANDISTKHFNNYFDGKSQDYIDNHHMEWMEQFSKDYPKESGIVFGGGAPERNIVADFPMSEVKHHQFQIVGAINDAIKEGIDTVAIPIQRENELAGSAGVTKFYESLNTKILPDIRKKLEKQGLKIKVDKKPYKGSKALPGVDTLIDEMLPFARDNNFASMSTIGSKIVDFESENGLIKSLDELNKWAKEFGYEDMLEDFLNTYAQKNDLWTLTIEEVPNGKVKWDVYSVLTALGLGSYTTQSEANTKVSDNPNIYKLAKRVGSKLNYNESDTEIADYFASIESSGGDYNARNKESSAFGKYQVIKSTLAEKAKDLGISIKEARTPEGQEMVMHSLLSDYKSRLKDFDLPVTKENMFVLHNLGQTGGVRVLRGTYTGEDIKAMRANVSTEERKLPNDKLVKAYTERYNINIPPKQES